MAHPCLSLALWLPSWYAGRASSDALLAMLHEWAPIHACHYRAPLPATNSASGWAGLTEGVPEPGAADYPAAGNQAGPADAGTSLLQLLRRRQPRGVTSAAGPAILFSAVRPGRTAGLPVDLSIRDIALASGGMIAFAPAAETQGATPWCLSTWADSAEALEWWQADLPAAAFRPNYVSVADAEFRLREAIREVAEVIERQGYSPRRLHGGAVEPPSPRAAVAELMRARPQALGPADLPSRVRRTLETAEMVEAMIGLAVEDAHVHPDFAAISLAIDDARSAAVQAASQYYA